jgi:hypothetical protein
VQVKINIALGVANLAIFALFSTHDPDHLVIGVLFLCGAYLSTLLEEDE